MLTVRTIERTRRLVIPVILPTPLLPIECAPGWCNVVADCGRRSFDKNHRGGLTGIGAI
jgi:hypothetical protein